MKNINVHILGSNGWIGSELVKYFSSLNYEVIKVNRQNLEEWINTKENKNIVIYAIGITGDFRSRILESCEANVSILNKVLKSQAINIDNFVYLSSTRIYMRNKTTTEDECIYLKSDQKNDFYNISKLMGEALVLTNQNKNYKVLRLSNVLGLNQPLETFVGQLVHEAKKNGNAQILQSIKSAKDYIAMKDLTYYVEKIITKGVHRIYNVAYGQNISHADIANWLNKNGFNISFKDSSSELFVPTEINISRLLGEFKKPSNPLDLDLF